MSEKITRTSSGGMEFERSEHLTGMRGLIKGLIQITLILRTKGQDNCACCFILKCPYFEAQYKDDKECLKTKYMRYEIEYKMSELKKYIIGKLI